MPPMKDDELHNQGWKDIPHDQFVNGGGDVVLVNRAWYEYVMVHLEDITGMKHLCPFCGSNAEPIKEGDDETFYGRVGCGACDRWWSRKTLKKP